MRATAFLTLTALMAIAMTYSSNAAARKTTEAQIVEVPVPRSPLISFRVLLRSGSVSDPEGKEGLNALTALMLGEGGTKKLSYNEIINTLYPWAAEIDVRFDKEYTVLTGEVHRDHLNEYFKIFSDLLLEPRFDESDFTRNKELLLNYLQNTLRGNDDENLGKQALNAMMYAGHPYRTTEWGTVEGLKSITLDDVKAFYSSMMKRGNIMFGIAGGYPKGFIADVKKTLAKLPAGSTPAVKLPAPAEIKGIQVTLVQKDNRATAISFGFPIDITRSDKDFYPLMVANSYLGEHRTFNGVLMNHLRGDRGLNYGDYSYIENFIQEGGSTFPVPNIVRSQQFFSVWIRPVAPQNAHFALRQAIREVQMLVENGMTKEQFEATRKFVVNYSKLWVQTQSRRLGYVMDSKLYGTSYFIDRVARELKTMTVDDVNRAVRKHLNCKDIAVAMVVKDAEGLRDALIVNTVSPITYQSKPASQSILDDDKIIEKYPLDINKDKLVILPVNELFEK